MKWTSAILRFLVGSLLLSEAFASLVIAQAADEPPTPSVIFSTLRDQLSRVNSIRYKASARSESPSRTRPGSTMDLENRTDTVISGDKYLVKAQVFNSELDGPRESTQAYDGREYQLMDDSRDTLITSTTRTKDQPTNTYRVPQPITQMFTFAFGPLIFNDYSALKQPDLWDRIAATSKITGRELVGSVPCVVVQVNGPEGEKSATLFLAESMGYYPLKVVSETKILTRTDRVETFESVANDGGVLVIPTRITTSVLVKKSGRSSSGSMIVQSGTLEVNGRVRDGVFTLPKSQASRRVDMTTGVGYQKGSTILAGNRQVAMVQASGIGLRSVMMAGLVGLIALGLGWAVFRKARRAGATS